MKTSLIYPLKLKSGLEYPTGTPALVSPKSDRVALVYIGGIEYNIRMSSLHRYFEEFIEITVAAIGEAVCDGSCCSVTGMDGIEPDGHDFEGWPSILLAIGI